MFTDEQIERCSRHVYLREVGGKGRKKRYIRAGHIPGARSFSWDNYTRTDEKGVLHEFNSERISEN